MTDDARTAHTLLELGAATLGESGGRPMRNRIRAAWPGASLAAPAYPVACTPGDNLAIHVAVARAPAGHALVVSVGETRELGYWGEVLTTAAEARHLAGLVIDGCVRDVAALAAHGFPVFSTGIALPGATKDKAGSVGSRALVGDVEVVIGRLGRGRRRRRHRGPGRDARGGAHRRSRAVPRRRTASSARFATARPPSSSSVSTNRPSTAPRLSKC